MVGVATLNATVLDILFTVTLDPPDGKYTIVNGPPPLVDVYVNCPVEPNRIVLPLKVPCGLVASSVTFPQVVHLKILNSYGQPASLPD